jgi:F-type H+-transporting ATPase subunit epsilon
MMAGPPETTEFELVSPERLLISEAAEMVVVPGTEGDFGALPRHAPMITGVRPGVIDVYNGGKVTSRIFVAGGFADVSETRITVLAEEALPVAELSLELAQSRQSAAEAELAAAVSEYGRREALRRVAIATAMRAALA